MEAIDEDQVAAGFDLAEEQLHRVIREVFAVRMPKVGPHLIAYVQGGTLERLGDVRVLFERMRTDCTRLTELFREEGRVAREHPVVLQGGATFPEPYGPLHRDISNHTRRLRLDFESIYQFGALLLDQWAFLIGCLAGSESPTKLSFSQLVTKMGARGRPDPIDVLARHHWSDLVWLDLQFKVYRNIFVVHSRRPWQRGTSAAEAGRSFNLESLSPPGWIDDANAHRELREFALGLADEIRDVDRLRDTADARGFLPLLLGHAGAIRRQADRETLAALVGKVGMTTPSFQVVVERLVRPIVEATPRVLQESLKRPEEITLGDPFEISTWFRYSS